MAKRKAKAKTPPSQEVTPLITDEQLVKLLKNDESLKKEIGSLTGALREKIAHAVEKMHLHKGAFAKTKAFWKMKGSPEKMADEFRLFIAYMDKSGLMDIIDSVGELQLGDEQDTTGGAASKVSSLAKKRAERREQQEEAVEQIGA